MTNGGIPISEAMMVTTGTKHTLATGSMTLAWREWKWPPTVDRTWPNWKMHWTVVFAQICNINCMTGGGSPFGGTATEAVLAVSLENLMNPPFKRT